MVLVQSMPAGKGTELQISANDGDGFSHGADGTLFKAGYLRLRNAQSAGYLHLGFAAHKAQGEDLLFPLPQSREGTPEGDVLHPLLVGVFGIPYLIHHRQGITAVCIYRIVKTHGGGNGIHGKIDLLNGQIKSLGDLLGSEDVMESEEEDDGDMDFLADILSSDLDDVFSGDDLDE